MCIHLSDSLAISDYSNGRRRTNYLNWLTVNHVVSETDSNSYVIDLSEIVKFCHSKKSFALEKNEVEKNVAWKRKLYVRYALNTWS